MDEIWRHELDARTEGIKAWVYQRMTEQQDAKIDARFAQLEAKMERNRFKLILWAIGIGLGCTVITIAVFTFLLNSAVNAVLTAPADDAGATSSNTSAQATQVRLLHRLQRHHQAVGGGIDARRHELHPAVAQVFHPE
ncbi:hypothetical protein GCM10027321_16340 [Massilia terrae]|uniref:Uncharacterized protein n=1 Tax=Massilia terrae TaxID=1811224 RepID=A0ABT2D619_9BURK|nr:hypothetical protein [Massilia terrae]MCS0661176.1 hypothetical protein [Massilia terrae]